MATQTTQKELRTRNTSLMAGFEVEDIEDRRTWANGVVVGLVANQRRSADKLSVTKVDIGKGEPLNIVTVLPMSAQVFMFQSPLSVLIYLR